MSSNGALPQTLKSITTTKISELSKQRILFEKRRDQILTSAQEAPDLRSKAQALLEGVTRLKGDPNDAFDREDLDSDDSIDVHTTAVANCSDRATHVNIRRFLLQSQYDPSISEKTLKDWIARLEEELRVLQLRHEHASFYSKLVTEWLENLGDPASSGLDTDELQSSKSNFEQVGRGEMHEQRATWETLVFATSNVDADTIRTYLDGLFTKTALSREALKQLREKIKSFGTELAAKKEWLSVEDLEWVSKALLKSDLLTKEKTAILKEFMRNPSVSQEVVDVLNMRLASLDSWTWPEEGIPVEMRRQLNGKYRVFMDEDLLDSLMFQYLGLKWSVAFRSAFVAFLDTRAWKSLRESIPKSVRERRQYFLNTRGDGFERTCVNDYRREMYKKDYFMTQLPSSVQDMREYDDNGNNNTADGTRKNALETKHSLLHLLVTESMIHTSQHGQFTAVRSDFKWFGPSLPHTTMLTVLAYFGVPQTWLNFFKSFLEAPLQFTQDGADATSQVRKRGIPMSHTLSDCFGEAVLFCMDYAVNQSTEGSFLYRLHDDFWFWGEENTSIKAWDAMIEFAKVMGLEFNEEKTGTVRMKKKDDDKDHLIPSSQEPSSSGLPHGEIGWGFLRLDSQEGRFIIDQEQVDSHIIELGHQLSSCKSIFAWVQAWNSYFARFFANNFAKPSLCFGRKHIDMVISTLSRIERTLFPDGGVTNHLRKMMADRFDIQNLPEGFFYFPIELGGLELLNPYIPLLAMREDIAQTPNRRLQKAVLEDEIAYHAAKERFEKFGSRHSAPADVLDDGQFMSLDEYMQYRESFSKPLLDAYMDLIGIPKEININQTARFLGSQVSLDKTVVKDPDSRNVISHSWPSMSPYWRWTAEVYHEEMVRRYGSLAAVNREFMPLGVIQTLKEGKFRWQG